MLKRIKKLLSENVQPVIAVIVILSVAGIGIYTLTGSHATTPYASIEAPNGTLSGGSCAQANSSATDGSYVKFGDCTITGDFFTPTDLYVAADTAGEIDLSWRPSESSSIASYTIYRDNNVIATVSGSNNTYTDSGVTPGAVYRYSLTALNNQNVTSGMSNIVSITAVAPQIGGTNLVTVPASFDNMSIPSDCSADVTVPLTDFILKQKSNSIVQFAAKGCYEVDGTIFVAGKTNFTIDGNGASFKTSTTNSAADAANTTYADNPTFKLDVSGWPRTRAMWMVITGDNTVIKNLNIVGPNNPNVYDPDLEAQAGIYLQGAVNCLVENNTIRYVYGDGIGMEVAYESANLAPSNDTVANNHINYIGRQGISVTAGSNLIISNNSIYNTPRSIFDVEPDGPLTLDNIQLLDNVVGGARLSFFADEGDINANISNVTVAGNTINGMVMNIGASPQGTVSPKRTNVSFLNNNDPDYVAGTPYGFMLFNGYSNLRIIGNFQQVASNRTGGAVTIDNSQNVTLQYNEFSGAYNQSTNAPNVYQGSAITGVSSCGNLINVTNARIDGKC